MYLINVIDIMRGVKILLNKDGYVCFYSMIQILHLHPNYNENYLFEQLLNKLKLFYSCCFFSVANIPLSNL